MDLETKNILLELRKTHGLTQEEMAGKLLVTRQAVSRWENGETLPSIDTLKIISDTFNMPLATLLGMKNNAPAFSNRMNIPSATVWQEFL